MEAFCGGALTHIHYHDFRWDASTYPTIAAEKPYRHNHLVKKMEYVGHVQKRIYAHLKVLKSRQNKGADGKVVRMGGKGRLADDEEASEILWQGRQYALM